MGDLAHHRLHREGARDVRDRAEPADAGERRGLRVLAGDVGDLERHVDEAHAEFEGRLVLGTRGECRGDGRGDAAMAPGDHLAALVEPCLDPFHGDRVQEIVADVVLARPLHLDRRAELLRQQRGLEREVAFRLAAETAAEQRDVDRDIALGNAERLRDVLARAAGALHRRPDLRLVTLDVGDRHRRLHADMGKVRQIVFADDDLVGALQSSLGVAFLAHDEARLARGLLELLAIGDGVVFAVGAVVPGQLQRVAALDRRAGVARDHGNAAERLEFRRPRPAAHLHHLLDAGDLQRRVRIERDQLAAGHRRARDARHISCLAGVRRRRNAPCRW